MKRSAFKRLVFYLAAMLLLLYMLMLVVTAFMTFAEYKLDITSAMILDSILQTARHPVHYGAMAIKENNPLFIIGVVAIIAYLVFLYAKSFTKEKSWETDKNDTHGSAKWMDKKSLVKGKNYHVISYNTLYEEWEKSMM